MIFSCELFSCLAKNDMLTCLVHIFFIVGYFGVYFLRFDLLSCFFGLYKHVHSFFWKIHCMIVLF